MLSAAPTAEFTDHEYPIQCVSIDSNGEIGAAGAEDGSLVVWDLKIQTAVMSYQCSAIKK
jgi:WD40 repeat protein